MGGTYPTASAVPESARDPDPDRRLREIEAIGHLGSWSWDIIAGVVTWSDELYRIYGLAPQSIPVTYESFLERVHPDDRDRVAGTIERCAQTSEAYVFTHRIVWPDGTVRWHQGRGQAIMAGARAVRMHGVARDVTERVESERALRESVEAAEALTEENVRLRAEVEAQLAEVRASRARIVEAGDEARRRLERDLHDGAQQRLTTLGLMLRTAELKLPDGGAPELAEAVGAAAKELEAAMAELRTLARGLHPAVLTNGGLVPALEALVARSAIPVALETHELQRLPAAVEAAAYFVVAEALTNVVKHARATSASVSVDCSDGRLTVQVADKGAGGADLHAGGGLRGLADRLAALDGELELHSRPDQGTCLRARVPCG